MTEHFTRNTVSSSKENGKLILELTRSQQMALIDLISEALPTACEEYIDCSQDPAVVTTPGQLLKLISEAKAPSTRQLPVAAE